MAEQPKFDTHALVKFLEAQGVPHAEAHAEAHAMASKHVYSKTESDLMNAETTREMIHSAKQDQRDMLREYHEEMKTVSDRFDRRTEEISKTLGNKVIGGTVAISFVITILIVVIELIHH